jgi:hypothetical protein
MSGPPASRGSRRGTAPAPRSTRDRQAWASLMALCVLWLVAPARDAAAQAAAPSRFAVSIGPQWLGTTDQGGADAVQTGNGTRPVTLFRTESELRGGLGLTGGFAARIGSGLWAEVAVRYHSSRLTVRTSDDLEGADATAREGLQQYQIEVGALWAPARLHLGRRAHVYAVGGGGYLRQLHSRQLLAESGRSYHVGGGALLWLPGRQGGTFNAVGLRLEGRAVLTAGGTAFDDRVHTAPAVSASLFLRF